MDTPNNRNLQIIKIMIIYNVTANIDDSIHEQWLIWIKEHIPKVLATGKFIEAKLTKVLTDDDFGTTYSVQYRAKSHEELESYYKHDAPKLRAESVSLFGDKMLTFRTELEIIDEYSVNFK